MILETLYCAENDKGLVLAVGASESAAKAKAPTASRVIQIRLTPSQLAMAEDGMPEELFRTLEQRAAWWREYPPQAMAVFSQPKRQLDEETVRLIAEMEERKKLKTKSRIAKLLDRQIDTRGLIWNSNKGKWESDMTDKIKIHAYDKDGQLLTRACSSVATPEEIKDKVVKCFVRGGVGVRSISVTGIGGERLSAWEMIAGSLTQNDELYQTAPASTSAPPAEVDEQPTATAEVQSENQEASVAKTANRKINKVSKKAKAAKVAKPKKEKVARAKGNGSSKTGVVADLLKRKSGCTAAEILKATGWPAVSVPAMAKAAGLKLRKEKEKGSPTRYFGS